MAETSTPTRRLVFWRESPAAATRVTPASDVRASDWLIAAALLSVYFAAWWMHLRPGVFSYDSGFYIGEVTSGQLTNLKPYFYARFLQAVTLGGRHLEWAAVAQCAFAVLAFSRMLAVAVATRCRAPWIVLALALIANPYVANMVFYVQNDVLFSIAIVAVLVETLYVIRRGAPSRASWLVFAVFAPMALLFRQNGVLFLPIWAAIVLVTVPRRQWWQTLVPAAITSAIALASMAGVARNAPGQDQDLLYPAVIHEVVNLSRPEFQHGLGARIAPETRAALGGKDLPLAVTYYKPLYWDSIAFFPNGPMLVDEPPQSRDAIVHSFLRRDLAANLPQVFGHRIEIFLGALLARAELADPYYAPPNLPPTLAAAKAQQVATGGNVGVAARVNHWSIASRQWTWNALFGVIVLAGLSLVALWRRDVPLLLCALLLWAQAGAIFLVAPSAEYRYVFPLYLAPLLLLVGHRIPRLASEPPKNALPG